MDGISEQRMKEIQEEMNRFETEISGKDEEIKPPPAPFHLPSTQQHNISSTQQHSFQTQQHFNLQTPSQNPPRPPSHPMSHNFNPQPQFNQQQPSYNHQPPPQYNNQQQPRHPPFNHPNMFAPRPFPNSFQPMFVPPQLRNRPLNPPPAPPLSFGGPNHYPASLPSSNPPKSSSSISAPKVVYSAPPIKNKTPISTPVRPTTTPTTPYTPSTVALTKPTHTQTKTDVKGGVSSGSKEVKSEEAKGKKGWKRVGENNGPGGDCIFKVAKVESTTIGKTKTTPKTTTKAPTSTPATTPTSTSATTTTTKPTSTKDPKNGKDKKKKFVRMAAGNAWEDTTLNEWDADDFRIFCGDLGNEVTDDVLIRVFNKFPSFQKARVIRDKRTNKTKGYGFASFKDPNDFMNAIKEVNGRYVGNRPIKLKKSCWQDRQMDSVKKRGKEKKRLGYK